MSDAVIELQLLSSPTVTVQATSTTAPAIEVGGPDLTALVAHLNTTDPHPQYATDAELANGLALKEAAGTADSLLAEHVGVINPHSQYATDADLLTGLSSKADLSHLHAIDEVTGLTAALGTREVAGTAAALLLAHTGATDPHSQYALGTDLIGGLAGKADTGHTHPNASTSTTGFLTSTDWNTFSGKEAAGTAAALLLTHTSATDPHSQYATDTDLMNGLATKADTDHTHPNASTSTTGFLTSTDWNTFNGKEVSGTAAGLLSAHTSATNPHSQYATSTALTSGLAGKADISHTHLNASSTVTGFLSSTDWNTFNGKEVSGTAAGLLSAHSSATDPHPQYIDSAELASSITALNLKNMSQQAANAVAITGGSVQADSVTSKGDSLATSAASGSSARLFFQTSGGSRWGIGKTNGAETGSNAGSDFSLWRYGDDGTFLGTPVVITRGSGYVTINNGLGGSGFSIASTGGTFQTTGTGNGSVAGNVRGTGAVDLQTARSFNFQVASGSYSFVVGRDCAASNTNAIAMGFNNTAATSNSLATGISSLTKRSGEHAHASAQISSAGDAQTSMLTINGTTANATITELTNPTRLTLVSDSTLSFEIRVVARRTDVDDESASWRFEGCADRNATAASTAFVGTPTKMLIARDSTAWDVNIDIDPTNGAVRIQVVGEAGKTIRWVAICRLAEVVG